VTVAAPRGLEGTGGVLALAVRRDRLRLTVWVVALTAVTYLSGSAMGTTFPTKASIDAYARSVAASPAVVAMAGPPIALDTLPGIVISKVAVTALLGTALLAILTVVRHTRSEEEEGRSELLRATVVGRHAGSLAALALAGAGSLLLGVGTAVALLGAAVPASGSWLFGAGVTALGWVLAAVTLLLAQVFSHGRTVLGAALAVLGVAYVVRAVGDVQGSALVWLSPVGWSQATHVLGAQRWWPLLVPVLASALLVAGAVALADRRDVGAGLVAPRPGAAAASALLSGPVGLALRLQRGALAGWSLGLLVLGVGFGSLTDAVGNMSRDNPTLERYLEASGQGSLVDSYVATMLLILALLAGCFAVGSVLRLRSEETSGRLEVLLATGLSRQRCLLGFGAVTALGTVLVLLCAGAGLGVAYGAVTGDAATAARVALGGELYAPAVLALAALGVLLVGWWPRAVPVAWAALAGCFVLGWLGGLLHPPRWLAQLSPYAHTPAWPAEPLDLAGPLVVAGCTVLLVVAGSVGLRRRDLG
jgi:ABC-2 type transport system permease protein